MFLNYFLPLFATIVAAISFTQLMPRILSLIILDVIRRRDGKGKT